VLPPSLKLQRPREPFGGDLVIVRTNKEHKMSIVMTDQSRRPEQFAEGLSKAEASKRIDALKAGVSD